MIAREKQWQFVINVTARFMERNRLIIMTESRIHGDVYGTVRRQYVETAVRKDGGHNVPANGTGKTLIMCIANMK